MIKMGIEDTITYIDNQISELISKMIDARTKHIDAINKILTKIQSIQSQANLSYRQGRTYDLMSKVEDGVNQQFDVEKPRYQLSYTGSKMTLSYDSETIDVPSVPVFVFELPNIPDAIHKIGEDLISKNLYLMLELSANVEEEPNIQNSFGKYYKLEMQQRAIGGAEIVFATPKRIPLPSPLQILKSFKPDEAFIYGVDLHIDGVEYWFSIGAHFGRMVTDLKAITGEQLTDIEYDAILFYCTTNYPDDCWWIIFNNRYAKGNLVDSIYQRWVIMYAYQNRAMIVQVE